MNSLSVAHRLNFPNVLGTMNFPWHRLRMNQHLVSRYMAAFSFQIGLNVAKSPGQWHGLGLSRKYKWDE